MYYNSVFRCTIFLKQYEYFHKVGFEFTIVPFKPKSLGSYKKSENHRISFNDSHFNLAFQEGVFVIFHRFPIFVFSLYNSVSNCPRLPSFVRFAEQIRNK